MDTYYDLIIVGGGIAGMTAAIYGSRSNLKTLVVEQEVCGGLANWTHTIENFPSHPSINGMELMDTIKEQMVNCGVDLLEIVEITDFNLVGKTKTIQTDEGEFSCGAMILAMGRKPITLPLDNDWDDHIHYCSLCDGIFYRGKDVAVIGGGNSAFDESLYLESIGVNTIAIIETLDTCPAAESTQQKALATGKFTIHSGTQLLKIESDKNIAHLKLQNQITGRIFTKQVDGIFVFIGQKPATELISNVIQTDSYGYIMATSELNTNVTGVFAAGDIVSKKYRQLTTAMSDGTIAALEAHNYLCA